MPSILQVSDEHQELAVTLTLSHMLSHMMPIRIMILKHLREGPENPDQGAIRNRCSFGNDVLVQEAHTTAPSWPLNALDDGESIKEIADFQHPIHVHIDSSDPRFKNQAMMVCIGINDVAPIIEIHHGGHRLLFPILIR